MMGEYLAAEAAGVKVTRYQQSGAIDYGKALKALLPTLEPEALEPFRRASCERVRITALAEEDTAVSGVTPWTEAA
jgi:hypothetical protein